MTDPSFYLVMAGTALTGLAMLIGAGLAGWRGWLQLQHRQLATHEPPAAPNAGTRIEMADLKERIRKLEAIAAGVDL